MLRLFLRLYVLLMLPATAAFVFFMYVTDQVMAQMHAEQQRQRAGVAFDRAERIVTDTRVPDWQGRLKEIEATFRVSHEVVPLAQAQDDFFMSSAEKERLRGGQIAFRDRPGGGNVYLRRIGDTGRVLRIEWVGAYEYLALYYSIIVLLVTTALSLILFRLTRPLWRDLEALKAATARVGECDFTVRSDLAPGSMLQPISTAFNAMAGRVQALLQSHRDLEQGVAHELRTPLAQLKFDLELARTAETSGEREARFAAMQGDVVDLEELVLRRAQDEMRASGRSVAIEPPRHLPESLSCDSKYLARALINVVRNAVRYAHSKVALTVERAGSRTTISVDDDGPGVPIVERERLFEPFTRLEGSRGRDSGGVGLGLAIVKSVAEWHGGEARISDSPLGGARISISW